MTDPVTRPASRPATPGRRQVINQVLALPVLAALSGAARSGSVDTGSKDPFTLGVASGYPHSDGMVLWTRLAPIPDAPGGGMPGSPVQVTYAVATDPSMSTLVVQGKSWASADWAHSVHVEVRGLEPDRWYWYQFSVAGWVSPIGRTRTTPLASAPSAEQQLRMAVVCCQNFELGYFTAYQQVLADQPDLVVHVGDYIYEGSGDKSAVRTIAEPVPVTLDDYRCRHARYKQDVDLQQAHACCPWLLTWDDHEVENDYAADRSQGADPREWFLMRRAAAYKAYYEHMPLPRRMVPLGPHMRLHTEFWYGGLARFFMLDTRQYRSPEACAWPARKHRHGLDPTACEALFDPAHSMLGQRQRDWLLSRLPADPVIPWTILGQQTLFQPASIQIRGEPRIFTDGWDGFPGERQTLLAALANARVRNPVVFSGDVHAFYANNLKADDAEPGSAFVATEFACGAITSPVPSDRFVRRVQSEHDAVVFTHTDRRGYLRVNLSIQDMSVEMVGMSSVRSPAATADVIAAFKVLNGSTELVRTA